MNVGMVIPAVWRNAKHNLPSLRYSLYFYNFCQES